VNVMLLIMILLFVPKMINRFAYFLDRKMDDIGGAVSLVIFAVFGFIFFKIFWPVPNMVIGVMVILLYFIICGVVYTTIESIIRILSGFLALITDIPAESYDRAMVNRTKRQKMKELHREAAEKETLRGNPRAEAGLRYFIEADKRTPNCYVKFLESHNR